MAGVARAAGVSVMTVSRVLRGMPGCGAAKAEAVRAAAKKLGYRPDPLVGALMQARRRNREPGFHGVIAVINTLEQEVNRLNPKVQSLWNGAEAQAGKYGFRLEEFRCPAEDGALRSLLKVLGSRGVPGILWMHFRLPGTRLQLDLRPFASATYGFSLEAPALHRSSNFQLESMQMALAEVVGRGFRRPGYVTFAQAEMRVHRQWSAAWMDYRFREPGMDWPDPLVLDVEAYEASRRRFMEWLEHQRPDAVVASFGDALGWMKQAGVRVPEEAGFVALDADPRGNVSGIDQQWDRVGAAAVDMITGQLARNERGLPDAPKLVMVEGRWHEGATLERRFKLRAARVKPRGNLRRGPAEA